MSKPKKMGRPPLPKGEAKPVQIGVRFTRDEGKKLMAMAKASGDTPAEVLRMAAKEKLSDPSAPVVCRWSLDELQGKTVEFALTYADFTCKGRGSFRVRPGEPGKLFIQIVSRAYTDLVQGSGRSEFFPVRQAHADQLRNHPDQQIAEFAIAE